MFETSLNTINLSGTEFPIKCSLLVLEQIQDKYGDYKAVEDKIFRFTPDLDEKGEMIPMGEGHRTTSSGWQTCPRRSWGTSCTRSS